MTRTRRCSGLPSGRGSATSSTPQRAGQAVVLVTSVPWNGVAQAGADDWAGYTTERRRLADAIAGAGLADQMLMIAGDAHMLAIDDGTNTDFSSSSPAASR